MKTSLSLGPSPSRAKDQTGLDFQTLLCTEVDLNSRQYPQVYKSNDRLLLKHRNDWYWTSRFLTATIPFLALMGKWLLLLFTDLVPSSAWSSSSAAMPLPIQFSPLLEDILEKVMQVVHQVMLVERLSALEEAEFEDEGGEEGTLEQCWH